ncbi:PepSY domain-containing protein [Muricoccus aerilatus]|uniref:PepSY domain-containing protein n=1 Tax=Muricoccus aerilatus TaxID=452982 RepID=UPI0005C1B55E|nr:hypothetical protein [Roseomonas aerilata]
MTSKSALLAAAAAITLLASPIPAALAQSARLEMAQVPPHILAAARAVGALTDVTEVGIEVEGSRIIYEIKGRTRDGKVREVDFLADGTLEEIEEEVAQADVPQPVMQALQRWMSGFRPTKMERSLRPSGGSSVAEAMTTVYEFEGQHGGMEVDVEVTADGSRVMIVDDSRG